MSAAFGLMPRPDWAATTTLKGWRGGVYFAPVRLLHDPVTRSMMTAACRRIAG